VLHNLRCVSCYNSSHFTDQFQETFEERLHLFLEECDSLQGFHLLADAGDGFSGLASCIAEEFTDQFSQKTLVSFMTSPDSVPPSLVRKHICFLFAGM